MRKAVAAGAILVLAWGPGAKVVPAGEPGPAGETVLAEHPLGSLTLKEFRLMEEEEAGTGPGGSQADARARVTRQAVYDYGVDKASRDGLGKNLSYHLSYGPKRTKVLSDFFYRKHIFEASRPSPEEVEAALPELYPTPFVQQIVASTEAEAEEARRRVMAGENFSAVAAEVSTGLTSVYGGNVGFLEKGSGHFTPEEEGILLSMKAGEVSDVVRGALGYYLFRILEVRGVEEQRAAQLPLMEQNLFNERVRQREREVIIELRDKASITVYREVLTSQPPPGSVMPRVVARVDDEAIVEPSLGGGHGGPAGIALGDLDKARVLGRMINQILFRREAERLGYEAEGEVWAALEPHRRRALWEAFLDGAVQSAVEVSDGDLLSLYNEDLRKREGGKAAPAGDVAEIPHHRREHFEEELRNRERPKIIAELIGSLAESIRVREENLALIAGEEGRQ